MDIGQIIIVLLIWEIFHILLWELFKKKVETKLKKRFTSKKIIFYILSIFIAFIIVSIPLGIFKVPEKEAVVVTNLFGRKIIYDKPNLYFRGYLVSTTQNFDLRKNYMYFPEVGMEREITSVDNKIIEVSASLFYQISDLQKYAIRSKDSEKKLALYLESAVIETIKSHSYEEIKTNRDDLEKDILAKLRKVENEIGIEIFDFKFIRTVDSYGIISSKSQAQSDKIQSESLILVAENEAKALKIKSQAELEKAKLLKDVNPITLDYIARIKLIEAIEEGKVNTILIPSESNLALTIPNNP